MNGGERLLALQLYCKPEDGTAGVVGVDGGLRRVEGHFYGKERRVYIVELVFDFSVRASDAGTMRRALWDK